MARIIDIRLPGIGLIFTLKRWGASYNFCSVRLTCFPGCYWDFGYRWPRRDFDRPFSFLFDNLYCKVRIKNAWLGVKGGWKSLTSYEVHTE